jgi:hypothetical protein
MSTNDDIVVRLRNLSSAQDWETTKYLCADAADEIERLRERNAILFDALRTLTNGKSVYLTESLGRTVTMDAQNSWTETVTDEEARGE